MNILIIDDDQLSLFLTESLLSLEEPTLNILSFLSAKEALDNLCQPGVVAVPDVILLDLNMHVMDGWEFLDAIVSLRTELLNKCRIYILTSSVDAADAAKAENCSLVSGLIYKPLDTTSINNILHPKQLNN